MMKYISTRGGGEPQDFEYVLLQGLAPDGGLYVPETWPKLDLETLKGRSYIEIAQSVMYPFVEGCIARADFDKIVKETYDSDIFKHPETVPLHDLGDNHYVLELFHGPTIAFKDVALQLLGRLFDHVLTKRDEHITIVGATSGDTGSAAIEGCRHSSRTNIFIMHPKGRVSDVQRRQMTTISAPNVHNIALEGSFDDAQAAVKAMFNNSDFREEINLSAVNSINWARIMAQIVYYVDAALKLGAPDKEVSFVVPTGNFGNVFAGYAARKMGLPIKLVIATNQNDILTRFIESGTMNTQEISPSLSPSMDIQISSNFERFLFDLVDREADHLREIMENFNANGQFSISDELLKEAQNAFQAFRCGEEDTLKTMRKTYEKSDYVLDPHTAVGVKAAQDLCETSAPDSPSTLSSHAPDPIVILGTAHPAKFPDAVERAIGLRPALPEDLSDLFEREEHMETLPYDLETLQNFIREKR